MIICRFHLIGPDGIRHFQKVLDFLPGKLHDVKHVLVFIEIEHIAHINISLPDFRIKRKRSTERDVRTTDIQLQLMNQINKG